MKLVILVIGMTALVCSGVHASEGGKEITFSEGLQKCLFGENRIVDSEAEKEALLAYAVRMLHDEQGPTNNALVNECIKKDKPPKKITRSIEISGYDIKTDTIDARDYDFSFKFYEGPYVKIPFLGDTIDLEVNMTAFAKLDERQGAAEANKITQYGVDVGSIKYNGWPYFKPYLTLGYLNLDEKTTNVASGEVTGPPRSHNAKFLFGADLPISDYVSIDVTHEVGFKDGFDEKTLSKTGAEFKIKWGDL